MFGGIRKMLGFSCTQILFIVVLCLIIYNIIHIITEYIRKSKKKYSCMDASIKTVIKVIISVCIISFIIVIIMISCAYAINGYTPDIGSFLGGVIGGVATLGAIVLTIDNEKKVRSEEKSNGVRPIISAYQNNDTTKNKKFTYKYECWCNENGYLNVGCFENNCETEGKKIRELIIKNIGCGPIINLQISVIGKGIYSSVNKKTIGIGETVNISLLLDSEYMIVDGTKEGNQIIFNYKDIYGKEHIQSLKFGLRFDEVQKIELTEFGDISMEDI